MDPKHDRLDLLCLLDLKHLNETTSFTKELWQRSTSDSENLNIVTNTINLFFPKNFALNFSRLSILNMVTKTLKKLSKIYKNIGLFERSTYFSEILKNYVAKTTQALPYLKILIKEKIKNQEDNDFSLLPAWIDSSWDHTLTQYRQNSIIASSYHSQNDKGNKP